MKIDRLLSIITILLQNEKVTAPYLADKFEVSRRTINRDVEDICKAGIPIVTLQGTNGGIFIAEGYKIDKTIFTDRELRSILTGLVTLDSVTRDKKYKTIIDKFSASKSGIFATQHIMIDLSSHYKNTLAPQIDEIQNCIEQATCITFTYYNRSGVRQIILDPYLVVFQWSSWYVFGLDHQTNRFKLYKLNRLCHLSSIDQKFDFQEIPEEKLDFSNYFTNEIKVIVLFDESVKYRLIEEYGVDSFTTTTSGQLQFAFPFTNEEYLLEWLLSFGDKAELIEPNGLRNILKVRLENASKKYEQ